MQVERRAYYCEIEPMLVVIEERSEGAGPWVVVDRVLNVPTELQELFGMPPFLKIEGC